MFAYEDCLFVITTFDIHRAWNLWHIHFVCRFQIYNYFTEKCWMCECL